MSSQEAAVRAVVDEIGRGISAEHESGGSSKPNSKLTDQLADIVRVTLLPDAVSQEHQSRYIDFIKRSKSSVVKDDLQYPDLRILSLVLDAIKWEVTDNPIKELAAGLLGSAFSKKRSKLVHVSFVALLMNFSLEEASFLKFIYEHGFKVYYNEGDHIAEKINENFQKAGISLVEDQEFVVSGLMRQGIMQGGYLNSGEFSGDPSGFNRKYAFFLTPLGQRLLEACTPSA